MRFGDNTQVSVYMILSHLNFKAIRSNSPINAPNILKNKEETEREQKRTPYPIRHYLQKSIHLLIVG
jgi:hypothetical protein